MVSSEYRRSFAAVRGVLFLLCRNFSRALCFLQYSYCCIRQISHLVNRRSLNIAGQCVSVVDQYSLSESSHFHLCGQRLPSTLFPLVASHPLQSLLRALLPTLISPIRASFPSAASYHKFIYRLQISILFSPLSKSLRHTSQSSYHVACLSCVLS